MIMEINFDTYVLQLGQDNIHTFLTVVVVKRVIYNKVSSSWEVLSHAVQLGIEHFKLGFIACLILYRPV